MLHSTLWLRKLRIVTSATAVFLIDDAIIINRFLIYNIYTQSLPFNFLFN